MPSLVPFCDPRLLPAKEGAVPYVPRRVFLRPEDRFQDMCGSGTERVFPEQKAYRIIRYRGLFFGDGA
jgi:hypothetical protein